jgi:hypothetical protein
LFLQQNGEMGKNIFPGMNPPPGCRDRPGAAKCRARAARRSRLEKIICLTLKKGLVCNSGSEVMTHAFCYESE